jgi:MtfA peptidase
MLFPWINNRRRQKLLEEPFPTAWHEVLKRNVRHYQYVDARGHARIEGCVQVMLAEKDWAGGSGFELTDEMKVTVAGYAGVMTLGLDEPYYFDRLMSIIIYPRAYVPDASGYYDIHASLVPISPRLGESWHRGPVIVSWAEIAGPNRQRPGHNLVVHEFAHHLDGMNGEVDGVPIIADREHGRTWYRVTELEYQRLVEAAKGGEATLLDRYGATSHAEFFAVASECFFERPRAMRTQHGELYDVLANFYCMRPADLWPDAIVRAAS